MKDTTELELWLEARIMELRLEGVDIAEEEDYFEGLTDAYSTVLHILQEDK